MTGAAAASYQWYADDEEIEGADEATLLITEDMVGAIISVKATAEDMEEATATCTEPVGVYEDLELLSAAQTGKSVVTLTTNGPVTALDDIDVFRGSKVVEIESIDYEDDGAVVTLKNAIVADAEYTVVLTPEEEDVKATSATFVGEKAALTSIEFLNDYLVLKDNKYQDGFAYVKGYDQFGDEVVLSGLTVTAGVGSMTAYDSETGKITLHSDTANAYMLIKEVPVFVQVQTGNTMVTGSKTLTVSTRAFVDNIVFGDIKKDGTKRDDERLTITELSSGKYYVELLTVEDQYGNTLSADDLNDQVDDPDGPVLFVIPGDTGAFYVTGKFGTINDTTVLWLAAPAGGAKPGTMTLTITGAGGKTFTKDVTIEDDPYIDTMNITYPELYAGSAKSNTIEFSAVDQYGNEIDLWQFKPYVLGGALYFTDENHMTNTPTKMQVSNAVFNEVTDNTAKKTFEVTLNASASTAKSMAVFTTTTAGTKVYTGSVTIGETGTALQIKDTFGSSTQLDRATAALNADGDWIGVGSSKDINLNSKVAFEDVNGNTMVRGKDDLYPYFTSENLNVYKTDSTIKPSDYTQFAWVVTSAKIPDNTTSTPATITGLLATAGTIDGDGKIEVAELLGTGDTKNDYYVTLFGTNDTLPATAGGHWYKLDQRSLHVTTVNGTDKKAGYSIVAPGTLYIDKDSKHSVTVKVTATTDAGETYTVAGSRVSLTLDSRFTVTNGTVSGAIDDDTWTGDKNGSVEATVWVTDPDGDKVEVGTTTIKYTNAAPVATSAKLEYKSSTAGNRVDSRVGAEISGDVSDIELGNDSADTPAGTIADGVLTIINGNTVDDTITAKIVDQYGVAMTNTTFYLDGEKIAGTATVTPNILTGEARGAIEYRSGNVTNKFYFTADTNALTITTPATAASLVAKTGNVGYTPTYGTAATTAPGTASTYHFGASDDSTITADTSTITVRNSKGNIVAVSINDDDDATLKAGAATFPSIELKNAGTADAYLEIASLATTNAGTYTITIESSELEGSLSTTYTVNPKTLAITDLGVKDGTTALDATGGANTTLAKVQVLAAKGSDTLKTTVHYATDNNAASTGTFVVDNTAGATNGAIATTTGWTNTDVIWLDVEGTNNFTGHVYIKVVATGADAYVQDSASTTAPAAWTISGN